MPPGTGAQQPIEGYAETVCSREQTLESEALDASLHAAQMVWADADGAGEVDSGDTGLLPQALQTPSELRRVHRSDTRRDRPRPQAQSLGVPLPTSTDPRLCAAPGPGNNSPIVAKQEISEEDAARAQRLKEALADADLSQVELGRRIGLTEGGISRIMRGVTRPSEETLRGLARELRRNPHWLQHGIGTKELDPAVLERPLSVPRRGRRNPGLEAWLSGTPDGRACNEEERRWLRSIAWPEVPARLPDMAYYLAVQSYRQIASARG